MGFWGSAGALKRIVARNDVEVVWPVHPNPNVTDVVFAYLKKQSNVHLIGPLEYLGFTA